MVIARFSLVALLVTIISFVVTAALLTILVRREKKRITRANNRLEILLKETLSNLPAADRQVFINQPSNSLSLRKYLMFNLPLNLLACLIFILIGYSTDENALPVWLIQVAVVSAIVGLGLLSMILVNWRTKPAIGLVRLDRAEMVDFARQVGQVLAIFALLTFALDNLNDWLTRSTDSPVTTAFSISGFAFLVIKYLYLTIALAKLPKTWVHARLDQSDYEEAARRVSWLRRFFNSVDMRIFHATILKRAGRLTEAEYILHGGLVKILPGISEAYAPTLARLLTELSLVRMEQGRYAEAMFFLENAIELKPASHINYSKLAEIYLRAAVWPERALELILWGDKKQMLWQPARLERRALLGERTINRAWALAQLGRQPEADHALQTVLRQTNHKNYTALASIHYRAACIRQLQGYPSAATAHMWEARRLDPAGLYGQWASEALTGQPAPQ